jgi:putative transposase
LLGLIKHSWLESGGVYGYRKIHDDLREVGEDCGRHRVARLMRLEGLRSQTGYRRRPGKYGGKPAVASPNLLKRQFDVVEPNKIWVTDITYIRTYEGWLYLAVVLDLFSRQVVGWSMKSQMTSDLAIDALLMAVWRRKPKQEVMVHADQGSQYSSTDWRSFLTWVTAPVTERRVGVDVTHGGVHIAPADILHQGFWAPLIARGPSRKAAA